jgi:hypothetical protein
MLYSLQIIDKCHYDDEHDEWIVPFTKKKSMDNFAMSPGVKPVGGSLMLPDINQSSGNTHLPVINGKDHSKFDQAIRLASPPSSTTSNRNRPPSQATKYSHKEQERSKHGVPLLTLPGTLISAAEALAATTNESDARPSRLPDLDPHQSQTGTYDCNGIGYECYRDEKKTKKSKSKPPKASVSSISSKSDKMPPIGGHLNNGQAAAVAGSSYSEQEEGGRDSAGPVEEWDWERHGIVKSSNPELEYSDDEDFAMAEELISASHYKDGGDSGPYPPSHAEQTSKKRRKKKRASRDFASADGSSSLPPIDKLQATRSGGTTLPPI